ncbi:hypothetical protein C5S53_16210 [Methanophagales archaeon]|nr:hypothetical protein C5S53_16210 [Methanophagales archaeon]
MKQKNVVVWILLLGIVVLLLSCYVQAKELTEVYATCILEQIENGENIALNNSRITGELDLCTIELNIIPIARSKSEIDHGLEEELKIVESEIDIQNSVFVADVNFSNTQVRNCFAINNRTSFLGTVDFSGAEFCDRADFKFADFHGNADFDCTHFAGNASFGSADFYENANFSNADFADDADFRHVDFAEDAILSYANFAGDANLSYANFAADANLSYANFAGDAYFKFTDFHGNANFDSAAFAGDVYFTGATFCVLYLHNIEFQRLWVQWSSSKNALLCDGPTYTKLIENFRAIEQFEDADAAYYQYRRLCQANKKWSFSKIMDVLAWISCGYGVKLERPLILAVIIILIFASVRRLGPAIKRLKKR